MKKALYLGACALILSAPMASALDQNSVGVSNDDRGIGANDKGGVADRGEGTRRQSNNMGEVRFKEADANNDGFIDRNEFIAKAEKKFGQMDTDGDGRLTMEEKQSFVDKYGNEDKG